VRRLDVQHEPAERRGELAGHPRLDRRQLDEVAVRLLAEVEAVREDEQFRWFGLGWKVNTDLPGPASFADTTQFVTPEQVASALPCGADVREVVEKLRPFVDAGFTELALVQIGAEHQEPFIRWAEAELLPALRQETKAAA
jgi:hypothetical protein